MYTFNFSQSINDQEWLSIAYDSHAKCIAGAFDFKSEWQPRAEDILLPEFVQKYAYLYDKNLGEDQNIFSLYLRGFYQTILNSGGVVLEVRDNGKLIQLLLGEMQDNKLAIEFSLYSPNKAGTTSWIYSEEYTKSLKKYLIAMNISQVCYTWRRTPKIHTNSHKLKPLLDYYTENNSFGSTDNEYLEKDIYDLYFNEEKEGEKIEVVSHYYKFNLD